jgi:hypothetical protein
MSPENECGSHKMYLTATIHHCKAFSHRHPKAVSLIYFAALKTCLEFFLTPTSSLSTKMIIETFHHSK